MSNKYILVDDSSIAIGGTELSLLGIFEERISDVLSIKTTDLTGQQFDLHRDKIWIFGNITGLYSNKEFEQIIKSLSKIKFVKIEFDYNFCPYRGEIPHKRFTNQQCECPYGLGSHELCSKLYDSIYLNAQHIFFMSEKQRAIYSTHIPFINFTKTSILSSCFTKESLSLFYSLKDSSKNGKYAILEGHGGWHSEAKGKEIAKQYCLANNLAYDILPTISYVDHIKILSNYSYIVFLPIIHDTCPRCIIEAKLMNIEVITNMNSQHITEFWWKDRETILNYISSRPNHFWKIIDNI